MDDNVRSVEEGSPRRRIGLVSLLAFGVAGIATARERRLKMQGMLSYAIVLFLAWSVASVVWSDQPGTTLRKLGALVCLATGALGVSRWLSWQQLTMLVFASAGVQLILGLSAEIALGSFRPWSASYMYTGLGYQAFSAWTMSLLVLAGFALRERAGAGWQRWIVALMVVGAALVFLTKSRTPAVAFVIAALTYFALSWSARRVVTGAALTALVGSLMFLTAEVCFGDGFDVISNIVNLGRERESIGNLTGRTDVWMELLPYIQARPLLGYGYESFWTAERLIDFGSTQGWAVPDAHNGFINFALGVGLTGSLIYTVILFAAIGRSVRRFSQGHNVDYAFVAAALVAQAVNMLCVAIQMAPYLPCMVTMFLFAKLAFVEDPAFPADGHATRVGADAPRVGAAPRPLLAGEAPAISGEWRPT